MSKCGLLPGMSTRLIPGVIPEVRRVASGCFWLRTSIMHDVWGFLKLHCVYLPSSNAFIEIIMFHCIDF